MKYVIDASFVASLFLPDEFNPASQAIGQRLGNDGATAPALLQIELTNLLLVAERRKRITGAQVEQLSHAFDLLEVRLQTTLTAPQRHEVLRIAQKHALTAYDAAYLELSMRLGLWLVSLDQPLIKAAKSEGIRAGLS